MRNILAFATLSLTLNLSATDYYVSPSGNDANSGTSQGQAWQTLGRTNQATYSLQPGDRVLFERGGKWRGELIIGSSGNASSPVTYGAYGTGAKPIISGSVVVQNWTVHQGNIWKTNLGTEPEYIFVDGELMQIARFPNTGWLRNNLGGGSFIEDDELTQPNGYWNGATAVIRSSNWSYDATNITNHASGRIDFQPIYFNLDHYEWGYFIRDKLSELDMPGEYFYDPTTGDLYLQAPNNADPNNLLIEAAVEDRGCHIHPTRHHVEVDGLHFQHQAEAGVLLETNDHVVIKNCEMTDLAMAIESFGHHNTFDGNLIERSYRSAIRLIDDNSSVLSNELNDIAMVAGLGESNWGYFGIRVSGDGNVIRGNRLETIGYIGINAHGTATIEKNFVDDALALLNDGCAIGVDECDGLIIRDNIMVNVRGNLDSSAPDFEGYEQFAFGLYFGNIEVKNTIVERNTVANCTGSGFHVDHTMLSDANIIRDNTFYNNAQSQLSISDWSNPNSAGAQPPYYVANYNEMYEGNILYSLHPDQLIMQQIQRWGNDWSDWGTFSNNYYFNPYETMGIRVFDMNNSTHHRYTLERWQNDLNEDAGSVRSNKNWPTHEVINQYSGELVNNGSFDNGVGGWTGWPGEGQMTHDYTYFQNGAMKVDFTSNATYHQFYIASQDIALQNGQWYKLEFSLRSNDHGELHVTFQANSQFGTADNVYSKYVAFDDQQRDYILFFQSDRDEPGKIRFTNQFDEPTYWIDDVSMTKVDVQEVDPLASHEFFYNDQNTTQTFTINGCWSDVTGNTYTNSVDIAPFRSVILVKEDPSVCSLSTQVEETEDTSSNSWTVFPNPVQDGELLNIGSDHTEGIIQLLDMQGKLVSQQEVIKAQREVQLNDVPTGVYMLRLLERNGTSRLNRVSIQ